MSDQIWSDEELYIDICAEDILNRKDESSCSDNRTNNNQEGETSHQYIQEHSEIQNNNEGTVDNATMKHASDKNESEDEYYTNTEDDIPLVKLCSFQKKQRESSSSRLSDSEDNIPLKTLFKKRTPAYPRRERKQYYGLSDSSEIDDDNDLDFDITGH